MATDESESTEASCPIGAVREECSGTGTVWTSMLRVGTVTNARTELAQTFKPRASGAPEGVRVKARLLRRVSPAPTLTVAIRPVVNGIVPIGSSSDLARATVDTATVNGAPSGWKYLPFTWFAGGTAAPLQADPDYALVFSVSGPSAALVGIASHQADTYSRGAPLRRSERSVDGV